MGIDLMLGVIIGLIVGVAASLLLRKSNDGSSKIKQLEEKHATYRKQVDDHFVNTAVLFKGLTDQYRDVYRHIASGAGELCSEEAKAIQIDLEETALLAQSSNTKSADVAKAEPESIIKEEMHSELEENDDDVPLAGEVEMSSDIANEIKNSSANK